jgi:hypothetical protein
MDKCKILRILKDSRAQVVEYKSHRLWPSICVGEWRIIGVDVRGDRMITAKRSKDGATRPCREAN